jgi:hypothetical protein
MMGVDRRGLADTPVGRRTEKSRSLYSRTFQVSIVDVRVLVGWMAQALQQAPRSAQRLSGSPSDPTSRWYDWAFSFVRRAGRLSSSVLATNSLGQGAKECHHLRRPQQPARACQYWLLQRAGGPHSEWNAYTH